MCIRLFFNINNHMWRIITSDKLTKVIVCWWCVTNTKQRRIGHWSKKVAWNSLLFPANRKQGPVAITNNKHENVDKIQADYVIQWSGSRINQKKYI